jgi:putative SOS response-associated peptidase YedK
MPVILQERDEEMWLSDTDDVAILKAMLLPYNASDMTGHRVALRVNNPQNDDAHLVDVDKESPI